MVNYSIEMIQTGMTSISSLFLFLSKTNASASASSTNLPQQVAPQIVVTTTPEHIAEVMSTKNVWSLYEVLASSGLTSAGILNIVCVFAGFGCLYATCSKLGKLSGNVDELQVRLNKLSENQESIKLLLKTIVDQSELFGESFGEVLGLSGSLVEQTAIIVHSLNTISDKGGDLDQALEETRRRVSLVRNTVQGCVEQQKVITDALNEPFKDSFFK